MASRNSPGTYRKIAILFTVAFVAVIAVLGVIGHYGMPQVMLGTLLGGVTLLVFTLVGLTAGTLDPIEFDFAGRELSPAANGMASAAGVMGAGLYIGLAGLNLFDIWTTAAVVAGWSIGLLGLATGVAPYLRKSGATGITDFLGLRYRSRAVGRAAIVAAVLALLPALAATLGAASFATTRLFDVSSATALTISTAVVLSGTLLGGMRAITRTAILQYIVLAIAFLLPVGIISIREFGLPLPQLTFGLAADEALLHMEATGITLAEPFGGAFLPASLGKLIVLMLVIAGGVAVLPHLAVRSAMTLSVDGARRAPGFVLLFLLAVLLAAPAYAAFAQLSIMRDLAGTPLETLPAWIHQYGALGLVQVCGSDADSIITILAACRAQPGFTGNLAASDISYSADILLFAAPAMFDLPQVLSALVALGALAAMIACGNAILFTLASAVGHDMRPVTPHRISAGRQLLKMRFIILLFASLAAWLAFERTAEIFTLALLAISVSAGAFLAPTILGIWWKRSNAAGALAGIIGGTAMTLFIAVEHYFPGTMPAMIPNPARFGVDALSAAAFGIPVSFAATVIGSLLTPPPGKEELALLDAIRRPGGSITVHESEV